ncbi:hypothetical protein OPV22_023603 [Ensete ventricosum]|uniref:ZN622/Rei1/Reh1 zinc finger C2H2-type domain-containing protein n=1 Tax=Ensete ventricosum TaxID=4639 RepID=A0AAV8QMN3_ENSVE|nr:hypothetical protein OPV22_023603 [Ensete ventricosum]
MTPLQPQAKGCKNPRRAHAQHLKLPTHSLIASQELGPSAAGFTTIKPLAESEDDELDVASEYLSNLHVGEDDATSDEQNSDVDKVDDLDASCCFICDLKHESIESCMLHMHKKHGFFSPDVEYLKDPNGLLKRVGLKVKRDFTCLYYNDRCPSFPNDLEDFYDYSSRLLMLLSKFMYPVQAYNTCGESQISLEKSILVISSLLPPKTTAERLCIGPFIGFKETEDGLGNNSAIEGENCKDESSEGDN